MGTPGTLAEIQAKLLELEAKIDAPKSVQRLCPDCGGDGYVPYGRITLTSEE